MKVVSISEMKNRLSAYIELVRGGETVLITDRDKPVARLMPLERESADDVAGRRLELERQGVIVRARARATAAFLRRLPQAPRTTGDLLQALLQEREQGR